MFFKGYFSDSVVKIITTKAKITSQDYIGKIIKEEVITNDCDLFYDTVSTDGVVISSFDVNKANLILSNTMSSLKNISDNFNENGKFNVDVPVSYLFIPSSYIFPAVKINVETSQLLYYEAKIKSDVKEYGINSSLVSLILTIDIKYQVTIPMMLEIVENSIDIPLAIEVINGKVPEVLFTY